MKAARDFGGLDSAVERSISDLQQAMAAGRTISELVNAGLACIVSIDTHRRAEPTRRPSVEAGSDVPAHLAPVP